MIKAAVPEAPPPRNGLVQVHRSLLRFIAGFAFLTTAFGVAAQDTPSTAAETDADAYQTLMDDRVTELLERNKALADRVEQLETLVKQINDLVASRPWAPRTFVVRSDQIASCPGGAAAIAVVCVAESYGFTAGTDGGTGYCRASSSDGDVYQPVTVTCSFP